jgi:hypothetical protein
MSAGVMQSEYEIPRGQCSSLLDDLHREGRLVSPGFDLPRDGLLISLQKSSSDTMGLCLDFAECAEDAATRHILVMWCIPEEAAFVQLDAVIRRNGGVPIQKKA